VIKEGAGRRGGKNSEAIEKLGFWGWLVMISCVCVWVCMCAHVCERSWGRVLVERGWVVLFFFGLANCQIVTKTLVYPIWVKSDREKKK
jgi:hypothetical protein